MDHTPSYKNSTLSMMVLYYFISLGVIIIISILIAWLSPETYKLLSQENTLLLIVFGYYVVRGEGLVSAYLQSRKADTSDNKINNPVIENPNDTKPVTDDLYADKLQAYDPTDK